MGASSYYKVDMMPKVLLFVAFICCVILTTDKFELVNLSISCKTRISRIQIRMRVTMYYDPHTRVQRCSHTISLRDRLKTLVSLTYNNLIFDHLLQPQIQSNYSAIITAEDFLSESFLLVLLPILPSNTTIHSLCYELHRIVKLIKN